VSDRPIRILELRSVRGTGGGPEKTILLGTARTDRRQFEITVCYLRDARDTVFGIDQKAAGLSIDYTEIIERHSLDPSIWPKLRHLIRDRSIDIVHAHEYKTDVLAWMLARAEKVTPLSTVHGWTGQTSRELRFYYPLDKWILSLFPRLIAVSDDVKRELVRCGANPDQVVTVLNGIDHQAFHRDRARAPGIRGSLGIAADEFAIGAVGRLEPQKRFDVLIDAFADVRRQHRRARLLIAGDGSLRTALEQQISASGLSQSCTLLGHRRDVAELHDAFDLFVQSSDYEGTPNAVLEAMALETPIVATAAGGTAEICRDGIDGLIVPSGDRAALVAAMNCAVDDPAAAARRVAAARARVETELSCDRRMRKVEEVYQSLFQERRRISSGKMAPARI